VTDYSNDSIYWGSVAKPAQGTPFAALSAEQKKVVAASLGYQAYEGSTWYNASAPEGARIVQAFGQPGAAQFEVDSIDWGGVRAPADNAGFAQLTAAQRAIVAETLGYAQVEQQVFVNPNAAAGKQVLPTLTAGVDYQNAAMDWGTLARPANAAGFDDLTAAQQDRVLQSLGYQRWNGVVYHDAEAPAGQQYKLGFEQGTDYRNSDIHWSDIAVPAAGTRFDQLSAEQQFRVLEQTGFERYTDTVYYKAGAGEQSLKTSFTEGIDYSNAGLSAGAGVQSDRWVVADGEQRYVVVAVDNENDGVVDALRVTEAPQLLGQRGFGFLLTGTITTLQDNADFVIQGADDAIVRGNINLLGAGSDLAIQSDRWTYWEGQANVAGNITLMGGVELDGSNTGGANAAGTSLYVHATSTLNTMAAGSSIVLAGGQDVELHGRVIAGGTIGTDGVSWNGADAAISVSAGQQILVDTVLSASKSVSLTTTGTVGADDGGYAVVIGSAAGLNAAGITSDGSGGLVSVNAAGNVTLSGTVLSGGTIRQTFEGSRLVAETIDWSLEDSAVRLVAAGQMYLGGMEANASGTLSEIGATVRANDLIEVRGGANSDGIGVRMPGGARLLTANEDGRIVIGSAQDAVLNGLIVAGGEAIDHYDARGNYLGSTITQPVGDSSITIQADQQIQLGRELVAGKTIDVRGGVGQGTPTVDNPWADQGIVIGGNVRLTTTQENSTLTLSSSGDLSVLAPTWQQEIVADGFAEFAAGDLSGDVSLRVTLDLGTHVVSGIVTLPRSATLDNTGLGSLSADLQAAIEAASFVVVTSLSGSPALNSTQQLSGADHLQVRLKDGRLMFTSNYAFSLEQVAGGRADSLGLTQLAGANAQSARVAALDASAAGSVVNIGKADAPGGRITIAGWVRGHSAINMYAGTLAGGNQDVRLTATGVLETLDGSMVLNPGGHAVIEGDLIARGRYADVIINATDTIELRGDISATRNIVISAGTDVAAGETSVKTYGTAHFNSLEARGSIVISGVNDVVIDNTIGKDSPQLALLQVGSEQGTLTVTKESGWLETGGMLVLSGKDVDLAGVVRSTLATAATYDNEITISATGDVRVHGDLQLAGSLAITAGDDIAVYNTNLMLQGAGQRLTMNAGDAIAIGSVGSNSGGAILAASASMSLTAGGQFSVGRDAQLFAGADHATIAIRAGRMDTAGTIVAGASFSETTRSYAWTGREATLDIKTSADMVIGDAVSGANLLSSGRLLLQAGEGSGGLGLAMSANSAIRVDATGAGAWSEAEVKDGLLSITAQGDIRLKGRVSADDSGADLAILSRSQVLIDGLVSAQDALSITGGTDASKIGVLIETLVLDGANNYLSGGTLDTAEGGMISVVSTDNIVIRGVVGQQDFGRAKVGTLTMQSTGGDITVLRNVDVRDHVVMQAGNINVLAGSYVYATGADSDIYMQARVKLLVSGENTAANLDDAIVKADRLIHFAAPKVEVNGVVQAGIAGLGALDGRVLFNAGTELKVAGFIKAEQNIELNSGVNMAWSRERMEAAIQKSELQGGTVRISGQAVLDAQGAIAVKAGGDVTIAADAVVAGSRDVAIPVYNTVTDTVDVVSGYQQVAVGQVQVPEISWTTTTITEQVGTEMVKVGSEYHTMNVTLTQVGYYNPNAPEGSKFREFLVEGLDYDNSAVNWANAADEANPGRTAEAVTLDYDKVNLSNYTRYKDFGQLSDAQRQAVLNATGYMVLFQFDYTDPATHTTLNGNATDSAWTPAWAANEQVVYHIAVDGWKDKYIQMPKGAQEDILRVVSQGETLYLSDTTMNGESDGTWATLHDVPAPTGELVGRYVDTARVNYTQATSVYYDPSGVATAAADGAQQLATLHNPQEDGIGMWAVSYNAGSGDRVFDISGRTSGQAVLDRIPDWVWKNTGTTADFNAEFQNGRGTAYIQAYNTWFDALVNDTATLATNGQTIALTDPYNDGGAIGINTGSHVVRGNQVAFQYDYWTAWTETLHHQLNDYDFTRWGWEDWNGSRSGYIRNDHGQWMVDAIWSVYGQHDQVQTTAWESDEGFWERNDHHVLTRYRDEITVTKREDFNDFTYNWTSDWHEVRDTRVKQSFQLVTMDQDILDYRPVYQTSVQDVMVVNMRDVTVWETQPIIQQQTVTRTEVSEADATTRTYGEFAGDALKAQDISIAAGGAVRISAKLSATDSLGIEAGSLLQLKGDSTGGVTMSASLSGASIDLHAGTSLLVDDSGILNLTGAASTVALGSAQDMTVGGEIAAADGARLASVDLSADRNVTLSGTVDAVTIHVTAGAGAAGDGRIGADADARLNASGGDIVLSAGTYGGSIALTDASLTSSDTVRLDAAGGSIVHGGHGLITADAIVAHADSGITLGARVASVELAVADSGDVNLTNQGDLDLASVTTADGAISVKVFGDLTVSSVHTLGASDRNDINITTYDVGSGANVDLYDIGTGVRGDIHIDAQGAVVQRGDTLRADELAVTAAGPLTLNTEVNSLSVTTTHQGDVQITQGSRNLTVSKVSVADGSFVLDAGAQVDLVDVVLSSNRDGNAIVVDAAQDILVRRAVAGIYLDDAAARPVIYKDGVAVDYDSVSSSGDITLVSQGGAIRQAAADAAVDLVADRLTLRAAQGIGALEIAVNSLDAHTTTGDIVLSDVDGALESATGLDIVAATTSVDATGDTRVAITAASELRVGADGKVAGNTIALSSTGANVIVAAPASGDTLEYTRGVAFDAAKVLHLYRFFNAPERIEYRAGQYFLFGEGADATKLLPNAISADTVILETGESLSFDGSLAANRRLELIAGENISIQGSISVKGTRFDGSVDGDGLIDVLVVKALGAHDVVRSFDFNDDGDRSDLLSEAAANIDFNGDGDLLDSINEAAAATATGFIHIHADTLPAQKFELRARRDIDVELASSLVLTGFVGGLNSFDSARNVSLNIGGTLTLLGGIVAADATLGHLALTATAISADGASVFIADDLDVVATNGVQLNTLVNRLSVQSTVAGDIKVNEATGLVVDAVTARDGAIAIFAGGDLSLRDVRNIADGADIVIKAGGDMFVDYVEAAAEAGAQKASGSVTIDAKGTIREWAAPIRNADGDITGYALDQNAADLFGYRVTVNGNTAATPVQMTDASKHGSGDELEVRFTAESGGYASGATTVTQAGSFATGGAIVNIVGQVIVPAGSLARQVDRVVFGDVHGTTYRYSVSLDGTTYSVQHGEVVDGVAVDGNALRSVLHALAYKLENAAAVNVEIDDAAHALTLTAAQDNTPFVLGTAAVESLYDGPVADAVSWSGKAPDQAAGSSATQVTDLAFAGAAPAAGTLYTVMVNGNAYSVRIGANALVAIGGVAAGTALTIAAPVAADIASASLASTTEGGLVLDLSGIAAVNGGRYTVAIGAKSFSYDADASATLAEIASGLAAAIDADAALAASARSATVGATWTSVLGELKTRIESGEPVTAAIDAASGKLTLTADAIDTAFTVDAGATAAAALERDGSIASTASGAAVKQVSEIVFGNVTLAQDTDVTVVVNGKSFTVSSNDNPAIAAAATFATTTAAGPAASQVSTITFADAADPAVNMTYSVSVNGHVYTTRVDGSTVGATWSAVLADLKARVDAGEAITASIGASAQTLTLTGDSNGAAFTIDAVDVLAAPSVRSWSDLLGALASAIEADGGPTVAVDAADRSLTLTALAANTAFEVNGVLVSASAAMDDDGISPSTAAGYAATQVSSVAFNDKLAVGYAYTVTVGGKAYRVIVDGSSVAADWTSVLGALRDSIQADGDIDVAIDAAARSLTLTATQANTPFTVNGVTVGAQTATVVDAAAVTQHLASAGTDGTQSTRLTYDPAATKDGMVYTVTLGGARYTHTAADNDLGHALDALRDAINADPDRKADAVVSGNALELTARAANTAFSAGGQAADGSIGTPSNPLPIDGDYVLIIPDRSAGSFGMRVTESLTVVNLPTHADQNELIKLVAGDDLVVVSDIDVGNDALLGGTVVLEAANGLTLGGKVTATSLDIKAGDDLTITSEVGTLRVVMSGDGNLTVFQTGALNISSITMMGGDVTLVADGDIEIGQIGFAGNGAGGDVQITSRHGSIHLGQLDSSGELVLSALEGAVRAGGADGWIEADVLRVQAKGAISIVEKDDITIDLIESADHGAVSVSAGGALVVNGAITASGANAVSLVTTAGAIALNQAISTGSGSVTIDAAAGLALADLGDIRSLSGNVTLDAGSGALTMTGSTVVDAGSGRIALDADGQVTVGKLHTTGNADLVIRGGGIVDGGEGDTDIVAAGARLVLVSTGGVGSLADALEIQVASLDAVNTGSLDGNSGVALEEVDGLVVARLEQAASGSVSVATLNGAIVVAAGGVSATSGDVALYAGGIGGALAVNADIRTTGGSIALTAEDGDIVLAAGVRVAGDGDVTIKVAKGALLNAHTAVTDGADVRVAGWLTLAGSNGGAFESEMNWVMEQGLFTVDEVSGEIRVAGVPSWLEASHLANGTVLRQAGGAFVQSTGGDVRISARDNIGERVDGFTYSPLAIVVDAVHLTASSSERMDVTIVTTGAVEVAREGINTGANTGAKGGTTAVSSLDGSQTIANAVDAGGQDVSIRANDVTIKDTVRSAGATLDLAPLGLTGAILIGNTGSGGVDLGSAMHLDNTEIGYLQDGFEQIVIGSAVGSHQIYIGEHGTTEGVELRDSLVLRTPALGGEVYVNTSLTVHGALLVQGSGHTTHLAADTSATDNVFIEDSVKVSGTVAITAGSDGSGQLQVGASAAHSLDGDGDTVSDFLTLRAPGNIVVSGTVGATDALEGLSVGGVDVGGTLNQADNVTFEGEVTVNGDFVVYASGTVTFKETVILQNGGDLSIFGALNVVFEKGVVLEGGGDLLVEADEISFKGGNDSVRGTGVMTLRPTTIGLAMEIGTPPSSVTASTLNIDNSEIQSFADGFARIVFGHADNGHATAQAGAVRIGAIQSAGQPTLRDSVEVYGSSIAVEDYATPLYTFKVGGDLKLDAVNDITVFNQVEASSGGTLHDVTLYSAQGALTQSASALDGVTAEAIRAGHLSAHAMTGISLGYTELVSVSAENVGTGGDIVITETAAGSDLAVLALRQSHAEGNGVIAVKATAGSLDVAAGGSGIVSAGAGEVTLGASADMTVGAALVTHDGGLTLTAGGAIRTSGAGSIASDNGAVVTLTAKTGDVRLGADVGSATLVTVTAGQAIVMADGTRAWSLNAGDTGAVVFNAGAGIALSRVEADGTMRLSANSGAIADALSGNGYNLDGDTAAVELTAATGIGTGNMPLMTRVAALSAANSAGGGIALHEATGLRLAGSGAFALDSGGANAALSIAVDGVLAVEDAVRTTGAGQGITLQAAGDVVFAGGAVLSTKNGNVMLEAGGAVALGIVTAGSGQVGIKAGTAITDAQDDDGAQSVANAVVNVTAGSLVLQAGGAAGASERQLETQVATLAATLGGSLHLLEKDGLALGSISTAGGDASLAAGSLAVNGLLDAGSGNIALLVQGNITQGAAGKLATSAGTIAVTSVQGAIVMAGGASAVTNAGAIHYTAAGNITLGLLDARTNTARADASLAGQAGWGAVSIASNGGAILAAAAQGTQVFASAVQLSAANAVGSAGAKVNTEAAHLAASAGAGGIYLADAGDVTIDALASGGNAALTAASGNLVVGGNVTAAGNLLLQAASGALSVRQAVSAGGNITLQAGTNLEQQALVRAGASVDAQAGAAILMDAAASTQAAGGLRYTAGGLLAVGALNAGGTISLSAADIADAGGDEVDLKAAALQIVSGGSAGSAGNALDIEVAQVAAQVGGNLFLTASGNVSLDATSAAGTVVVNASGDVAVASMAAADIQLSAGGSIVGAASGTNLTANTAQLNAAGAIGGGSQHLEVRLSTLTAAAGAGGMFVTAHDGLTVAGAATAAGHVVLVADSGGMTIAGTIDSAGGNVLLASETGGLVLGGTLASGGGNISLRAGGVLEQRGDVAAGSGSVDVSAASVMMADDAVTRGAAIRVAAAGDISLGLLDAGSGSVSVVAGGSILDAQAAGAVQTTNVQAGGLRLSAGIGIGAAGNANALEIAVDALGAYSAAGDISLRELDGLRVTEAGVAVSIARVGGDGGTVTVTDAGLSGVSAAGGNVHLETAQGRIAMEKPYTVLPGQDTYLSGDSIEITAPLQGQGGALLIQPGDALLDIQLGGALADAGNHEGSLYLSPASIANIGDGFSEIVIGSGAPGQDIDIEGSATPVVFHDQLVLNASGNGSVIHIEGTLAAEGLAANGAVEIAGGVNLSTGNGATAGGDLVFVKNIDGAAGSINDLSLAAGGDNVVVQGSIGSAKALDSLTIRDAADVSFAQAVTLDGDLVIHASGVVRFDGLLTLNGGTLTIAGASQVIIGDVVLTGHNGPLVLEADTLALHGSISGADTVVVKTADPARGITIGTGSTDAGTLNIDAATLARLASAGQLVFGSADATGKVTLGAIDFGAITPAPIEVHGGLVEVLAGSGVLKTGAALLLDGDNGVLLGDDIAAGGAVTIASSAGGVTMAAGTHVLGGGRIEVTARGGVRIGQLQADLVVVDSDGVMSGNGDGSVNIVAKQASLHGLGPVAGQGNALLVQAPVLHVAAPSGVVVQDTDPDGRTHFYLLDGGKMYEQAVALSSVERVSQDPAAPAATLQGYRYGGGALLEPMASLLDGSGWASSWTASSSTSSYLSGSTLAAADTAQLGMLSSSSLGLTRLFGQSFALGSAGQQALASGQPASSEVDFDYWLEDLVV
jgi:hypothetical protein